MTVYKNAIGKTLPRSSAEQSKLGTSVELKDLKFGDLIFFNTTGRGFMTRPELRLFYTYAVWNAAARGANIDSGQIYRNTSLLSGSIVGVQAETWY